MLKPQWTDGLNLTPPIYGDIPRTFLCSGGDGGGADGEGNQDEAQNDVDVQQMNAEITGDYSKYNRMAGELGAANAANAAEPAPTIVNEPYTGPRGVEVQSLDGSPLGQFEDATNQAYADGLNVENDKGIFGGMFNDDFTYNAEADRFSRQSVGQGFGSMLASSVVPGLDVEIYDTDLAGRTLFDSDQGTTTYDSDFNGVRAALGIAGGMVGGAILPGAWGAGRTIGSTLGKYGFDRYSDNKTFLGGDLSEDAGSTLGRGFGTAVAGKMGGEFGDLIGSKLGDMAYGSYTDRPKSSPTFGTNLTPKQMAEAKGSYFDLASSTIKSLGAIQDPSQTGSNSFGRSFMPVNPDDEEILKKGTREVSPPSLVGDFSSPILRSTPARTPTPASQVGADIKAPATNTNAGRQPLPAGVSYNIPYSGYSDADVNRSLRRDGWGSMVSV